MHAYLVFSGGGVKGAVFAGCLKAVEDEGIESMGFGGTSAGSIVAFLASIGFSGKELEGLLGGTDFVALLDDEGVALRQLKPEWSRFVECTRRRSWFATPSLLWSLRSIASRFGKDCGLYTGEKLKEWLARQLVAKHPDLTLAPRDVTFDDLASLGCLPLRVVAADLANRRAVVFGAGLEHGGARAIDAVLASASFPFVYRPVAMEGMSLSDGGLASNLPSFLFEKEYRESRVRTLAFGLVAPRGSNAGNANSGDLGAFAQSLLGCALEASDVLLRAATPGVEFFPIRSPTGIDTLDFALSSDKREACVSMGYSDASAQLKRYEPIARTKLHGADLRARIMLEHGPPTLYEPALLAVTQQLQLVSQCTLDRVRANIMLRTGRASTTSPGTRIVTYQIGMDDDPDIDLEIDEDAGCSGRAWFSGQVAVANLELSRKNPGDWKMTSEQHQKVPATLRSMISVAISGKIRSSAASAPAVGTLSVDCARTLGETGWCVGQESSARDGGKSYTVRPEVEEVMRAWARVVGAMIG